MSSFRTLILLLLSAPALGQMLVLPGDYPDPSVARIGDTYWATATTSNWAPAFPLLASRDLKEWELKGFTFDRLPAWADYYFWAPEISYDRGKVFVYYTAHKRDNSLCVAVASADRPEGPYTDHGPIICQDVGSIDAFPMRDVNGKLYLIWKEDGNSVERPTPIWAAEMNEERTALIGNKVELFRNDTPWEANLVEGVSMIRKGEYFYAFYSGAGCCGRACNYALGIARARSLLGPWEKFAGNPVLSGDAQWKCPGHGTPVEHNGKFYLLYHAYSRAADVYAGRQGLLSEFRFTPDGWIEFPQSRSAGSPPPRVEHTFSGDTLAPDWQWSVFSHPQTHVDNGVLTLTALPGTPGAFIGQKIMTRDYNAEVEIIIAHSDAEAGLALLGDEHNATGISVLKGSVRLWTLQAGNLTIIDERKTQAAISIRLGLKCENNTSLTFYYSPDGKKNVVMRSRDLDISYLPPWDRAVRIALTSKGDGGEKATFDNFILNNR